MSSATPVSEGFVPFRGFRTWYRVVGNLARQEPGRLPILTVHGGPGGAHDYLEPLEALAQDGRPVVFYDQLGSGNSDRPEDPSLWSVELFIEELATVRRELGLDRIHLLGQSWGGMLVLEYALRHPAGLVSLIVANSTANMPLHISEVNRLREELPEEIQDTLRQHEEAGTTDDPAYKEAEMTFYTRHMCRLDPWPEPFMRMIEKGNEQIYRLLSGPNELHITGPLKDWNVNSRLSEIRVPTLIISGRYDEFTAAEQEILRDGIPGSEWVIFEESAHVPHLEETERFLEVLEGFLGRVEHQLTRET